MTTHVIPEEHETVADGVIASLRAFRAEEIRREQAMVLLAVEWVRANPGDPREARFYDSGLWEHLESLGCPLVNGLTLCTFAEAAGMSEHQVRRLVGESVALVYLLPRVWDRVRRGQIEVWRARKLAEECADLSPEAIAYVDRNMSLATARHTPKGREGLIKEAMTRFLPEEVAAREEAGKDERGVGFNFRDVQRAGTVRVEADLDLADALELEAAISAGARVLKEQDPGHSLDVRRSWALGDLARASTLPRESFTSDLFGTPGGPPTPASVFYHPDCACGRALLGERPRWDGISTGEGKVNMYIHLTPDALVRPPDPGPLRTGLHRGHDRPPSQDVTEVRDAPGVRDAPDVLAGFDGAGAQCASTSEGRALPESGFLPVRIHGPGIPAGLVLTADTVREWFTRPSACAPPKVRIRPVLDLSEHQHVDAYEVPDRLKEQAMLTTGGCVFPWCTRPAHATDCDHIIAWKPGDDGGPTCTCNLAPLCRTHHRAKTHADNHTGNRYTWWNYETLGEGKYLWRGPKGSVLLRTNSGTYDITDTELSSGPRPSGNERPPLAISDALIDSGEGPESAPEGISSTAERGALSTIPAALEHVESIARTLPTTEELIQRWPAPQGEKPYFAPRPRPTGKPWPHLDGTPPPY